jgi:hypothetical protein
MMPLQQNEADASRMDKDMLVTLRVMNWEDEEAGDTRTTILLRSAMDEDMLVTLRVMSWEDEEAGDMRQGRMSGRIVVRV